MSHDERTENSTPTMMTGNMSQVCKVCGEPAAGFHFGAFTCEGCKSFFGRTYNNLASLNECKNGGRCTINKKTRTSCKSCRLRKCLVVGMSKSGSRYGRRSNWFKIHFLMQNNNNSSPSASTPSPPPHPSQTIPPLDNWDVPTPEDRSFEGTFGHQMISSTGTKDTLQSTDIKASKSPATSSSESNTPDSSKEFAEQPLIIPSYFTSKELLALCNLPAVSHQIPNYLSPPNLAQKLIYPYYPNYLSLLSGRRYFDDIFSDGKRKKEKEPHNWGDADPPPLKMMRREHPQSSSPLLMTPSKEIKTNPLHNPAPVISSLHNPAPVIASLRNPAPVIASLRNPAPVIASQMAKRVAEPTRIAPSTARCMTTNDNFPIDLSVRNKSSSEDEKDSTSASVKLKDDGGVHDTNEEKYKISFVCKSSDVEKIDHQQIPLDLSRLKGQEYV